MESIISYIVVTVVGGCMMIIAFLVGVLCAIPENDPDKEIEYLKKRINTLEEREHIRILEEHEYIMQQVNKDPSNLNKEKKVPAEKKVVQTTWGNNK